MSSSGEQPRYLRPPWIAAGVVCALVVTIPLLLIHVLTPHEPELRLVETGGRFSALIVTDNSRLLVVNTAKRTQARALLGRVARPWEPGPSTILAPGSEQYAPGVWETLQRTEPQQLIVAGIPGADPTWHAIEQYCREREIRLDYVSATSEIEGTSLSISLETPGRRQTAANHTVVVGRSGLTVALPLSDTASVPASDIVVSNDRQIAPSASAVLIRGEAGSSRYSGSTVIAGDREVIWLVLERGRIRVRGGTFVKSRNQGVDQDLRISNT